MGNPFVSIVAEASAKNWCVRPYCTTCGSREYRAALAQLAGPLGGPLCDALCTLSPDELTRFPRWDEALEVAIGDIPLGLQVEAVLNAWLPRVGLRPEFDDVVLFRIVRSLSDGSPTRRNWVRAAVPGAVKTKNHSLIETLVLVLGPGANRFPELITVASELAIESKQMSRVLRNVLGEPPA